MAELKKSLTSYRRTGSSGLVWNNKHVSEFGDPTQTNANEGGDVEDEPQSLRQSKSVGLGASMDSAVSRNQSTGATIFRKVKIASPSKDPPSPKLLTCGFFCFPAFTTQRLYSKSTKRR